MNKNILDFAEIIKIEGAFEEAFATAGNTEIGSTSYGRCFAYILAALSWKGELWHLTKALPHFSDNFDLTHMFNSLVHLGYKAEAIKMKAAHLNEQLFPCLFVSDHNKDSEKLYVVLGAVDHKIQVYDSSLNTIILMDKDDLKKGVGYFFSQLSNEELHFDQLTKNIDTNPMRWFRQLLLQQKSLIRFALFLSLFINIIGIFSSVFVMIVYDKVISVHALDSLTYLVMGMILAIGIDHTLRQLRQKIFAWYGNRTDSIIAPAILERIISLPPRLTESASLAAQVSRIRDFDSIRDFFTGALMMSIFELPFVFLMIFAIWIIAGKLALVSIALILVYIVTFYIMLPRVRDSIEESARNGSKRHSLIIETVHKLKFINRQGDYKPWLTQVRLASGAAAFASFRSAFLTSILEVISYILYITAGAATLAFGIYLVINNQMSSGALIASMILIWRILSPLQVCCTSMSVFIHLKKSILQVHKLLLMQPEQSGIKVFVEPPITAPKIVFSNVVLRHVNNPEIIYSGLNLSINSGELIMIMGHNGSGKSSLLKLINGIYIPQSGSIKINDKDLRQFNINEIRQIIGYVPEKTELFYGTLAQNLRLSNPGAKDKDLEEVLQNLGCWSYIQSLNGGLDYRIGDTKTDVLPSIFSYQLSLARAILRNSPIMLIDEAPHHFTNNSSHGFTRYLEKWRGNKTVFMITHTPELLKIADKVIFLVGDGRALLGTPSEIMKITTQHFGYDFKNE